MKKAMITILFSAFALIGFAQKENIKQDTVFTPIYQNFDTVKVKALLMKGKRNSVYYVAPAYIVLKGFVVPNDKGKVEWKSKPILEAVLDEKKSRVDLSEILHIIEN